MKQALVVAALAGCMAAAAHAGPLNKSVVPADAQWVVHVDVEALLASTCGRAIVAKNDPDLRQQLDEVKAHTGIDPLTDIKGATLYGATTEPSEGVLVVEATSAVDGLADRLKDRAKSFERITEGRYTVYSWTEHGSVRFALIHPGKQDGERLVLAAAEKSRLLDAAALIDGHGESLAKRSEGLLARTPKEGSVLFAAGSCLKHAEAVPFQKADAVVLDVGEADQEIFGDLLVVAKESKDATNILKMMQGAVAVGVMMTQGDADLADVNNILLGIDFSAEEGRIKASVRFKADRLLGAMTELESTRGSENHKARIRPAAKNQANERDPGR